MTKNKGTLPTLRAVAPAQSPLVIAIKALVIPQRLHSTPNLLFDTHVGEVCKTVWLSAKSGNNKVAEDTNVTIVQTTNIARRCSCCN